MFKGIIAFPQSVFSPERPPTKIRYVSVPSKLAPPAAKPIAAAESGGFNMLSSDETTLVAMTCWQNDTMAPMFAAVSKEMLRANAEAKDMLKAVDVVPHRPEMKKALNPSLSASLSDEESGTLAAWGDDLAEYWPAASYKGCGKVEKDDMLRVLGKSSGWLTSQSVDTFLSSYLPSLVEAEPGAPRIFLQGFHSLYVEKEQTLGFSLARSDNPEQTEQTRRRCAEVLSAADEVYVVYNIAVKHWALMRLTKRFSRLEVFDSTGHTTKEHGRKLLAACQELTGADMSSWTVVVYETVSSGVAQQTDGKSCGVFACVTAAHLLQDAQLPDIQGDIVAWRRYMAARIAAFGVSATAAPAAV